MHFQQQPDQVPIDVLYEDGQKIFVYQRDPSVQRNFLVKVYALLFVQLAFTSGAIAINVFVPQVRAFNIQNFWVSLVFMFSSMVVLIGVYFAARIFPLNIALVAFFTGLFGWGVGMICSFYSAYEVITAAGITAIIVVALSGYVLITNARLHWMGMGLGIALFGFMLATLVTLLCSLVFHIGRWWLFALSGVGAILMSLFILYDTSRIIHDYAADEVIPAAITLYTDIVNLFLYILQLLHICRNN
jgi:FtsH-binding integral membrane protein